jgi:hypothetical protein|tara:strand:+ start:2592 stop:5297 length:2706 start_codon:yes stop_codon:yes gene_type:complete
MTGGNNGVVIIPNDHANSLLWQKVNSGAMPPSGNLTTTQIDLIANWIDEGAFENPATDSLTIFISEYAEGSSNNKYLEIYNPTDQSIDLTGFAFPSVGNAPDDPGNYEYWNEFPTGSTIAPGDVFVIAHPSADATILAHADMTHLYLSNGDDGYCIVEGTEGNYTILDCIGDWNGDPGDGWDVAGVTEATKDHTLVRKSTVLTGNPDWSESAGTNADDSEWIVYDQNTWDYLGFHVYGTGGGNIAPIASAGLNQSVNYGIEVTLDGSGSVDPDGSIESYLWAQVAGAIVSLSSNNEMVVTFTAPTTTDSLSFILTVTDNDGDDDSDTVFVKTRETLSNQVFFSEYAEGSSNNKYLEIFNGSETDLDLSQYAISSCSNGCPDESTWDYPNNIVFATGTMLLVGEVYVISHPNADAAILSESDQTFTYLSNGDDVFGLVDASTGDIIDIIGEMGEDPGDGWAVAGIENATKDHTLVRKASIIAGNPDWTSSAGTNENDSEWIVYDQDIWDNLGSHSQNVDAPSVAITSVSPNFIADNTEIEVSAELNPVTGSMASASIYYGTDDALLNTTEMFLESGSTWMGIIPAQNGNILLQFKVFATDDSGNEGESSVQSRLIASSTPDEIDEVHANVVEDQIVTIQGIVTVGTGLLSTTKTSAYIQDESGRGLNLFDYELIEGINRGDELRVVGYVDQYYSTVEVTDFVYETISIDNTLPTPQETTSSGANSSDYEGTLISFPGEITILETIGDNDGLKLTIDDVTTVMIWNSTGVTTSGLDVGTSWDFTGIGSQYSEMYQLLVAYDEDIATLGIDNISTIPNEFALYPAFPNPFNPVTTISFSTDIEGEIHLNIYDINGRLVDQMNYENIYPGTHQTTWDASSLSSGVYFIRLKNNTHHAIQKVMLLK